MPCRILATACSFATLDGPHHDYVRQRDCLIDNRAGEHPLHAAEFAIGPLFALARNFLAVAAAARARPPSR